METWEYEKVIEVRIDTADKYRARVQLRDENDNTVVRTEYIKFNTYPTIQEIETQAIALCVMLNTPPLDGEE